MKESSSIKHYRCLPFIWKRATDLSTTMVWVTCIFIPLFIWIWHKFLKPLVDRWYGVPPKAIKDEKDVVEVDHNDPAKNEGEEVVEEDCSLKGKWD